MRSATHPIAWLVLAAACTSPAASPAPPSGAGPTPAPTATATTAPAPPATAPSSTSADRYGLVVRSTARSETDPRPLAELGGEASSAAVSPDGRRVALWEPVVTEGSGRVLWVMEGSAPDRARVVLTLPPGERAATSTGGGVVWSSDGMALLIGVISTGAVSQPGAPPGIPSHIVPYAAIRSVDPATGDVRELARRERSFPLRPVAWDRARGIAAAVGVGPNGSASGYVIAAAGRPAVVADCCASGAAYRVVASRDAARVLAVADRSPSSLHIWPTADPTQLTAMDAAPGERIEKALWRDDRAVVVLLSGDAPGAQRLELWRLDGSRRVLLRDARDLWGVRFDGSAAILEGRAVDLDTGTVTAIPGSFAPRGVAFAQVVSFALR